MAQVPDPDDILRQIDVNNVAECATELNRLLKKRRTFKSTFTMANNTLISFINASQGENDQFDRSVDTMNAMRRARETLELRYTRLERCISRMMDLTTVDDTLAAIEKDFEKYNNKYLATIQGMGNLMIAMSPPQPAQAAQGIGPAQSLRPIQALKPSFTLSFDSSPTELAAWIAQFKAYYEASKFETLPIPQQQAFMRHCLHPDVWTAIQQNITEETQVFKDPLHLDEDSCENFIENAFQIRYPLIMRRYRFFT